MMHLLAQVGGGGFFNWLQQNSRVLLILGFILFSVMGAVMKKAQEKRAKREAELARLRRADDRLRTGRNEDGSYINVQPQAPAAPQMAPNTPIAAEDARRKLQELAERRRRELAEVMRRAQQSGPAGPAGTSGTAPPTSTNPAAVPMPHTQHQQQQQQQQQHSRQRPQPQRPQPQRPQQPRPQQPRPQQPQQMRPQQGQFTPPRQATEREIRRQREEQSNRKAAKEAARRHQHPDLGPSDGPTAHMPSVAMPEAYEIPTAAQTKAGAATQTAAMTAVGAAMARLDMPGPGGQWRKAIVLGELLHRPVALRDPGESTF